MKRITACARDERGVALVMALIMLVALTGLVLAFLSVSAFEPQISRNLASTAQARMVADAGLEWAFNRLVTVPPGQELDQYWNNLLVAAAGGATLTGGAIPVPGLAATFGTFTVRIRNDSNATDQQITGVPPEASAVIDTNGRLIVTATGIANGGGNGVVNKQILAVVKRVVVPPINGALAFPGTQADVNFSGSTFDIQGIDRNMDGTPGPAPAVFGITVSTDYPANEGIVENSLAGAQQQNQVTGISEVTGLPTSGSDTIQADPALTSQMVTNWVDALKSSADVSLTTSQAKNFAQSDIGSTCPSSWASTTCWGTTSQPKIVYVKGDLNKDYVSVDLSGKSEGTGILIIENGRFEITGDFRWNGPIIVTGTDVGIRYKGGGEMQVYGAVIVNELNDDNQNNLEGDVRGNAKMYYSSQALALVQNRLGRRHITMYSWREQ